MRYTATLIEVDTSINQKTLLRTKRSRCVPPTQHLSWLNYRGGLFVSQIVLLVALVTSSSTPSSAVSTLAIKILGWKILLSYLVLVSPILF